MSLLRKKIGSSNIDINFVWGEKFAGNNYKSVTICGESFGLGDCVRCPLKFKESHVGKIIKLFQKEDKKMCTIRSFFSNSDFSPCVKGLNCTPKPKELFLAFGEGIEVEKDVLLGNIDSRCMIFCTANERFNEMPSNEQIEAADYFFCRAYDPVRNEIIGLDSVEEAIGAQKIYNKKDWLVNKVIGGLPLQGVTKGICSHIHKVSVSPPKDTLEGKLKRKSDNLVPNLHEVGSEEKNNESHYIKKFKGEIGGIPNEKSYMQYENLVFAIPAPSKIKSCQKLEFLPIKGDPSILSMPKAKAILKRKKASPFKVSNSHIALKTSKQAYSKDEEMIIDNEEKNERMFNGRAQNKISKFIEKSLDFVGRRKISKLWKRDGETFETANESKKLCNTHILFAKKVENLKEDLSAVIPKPNVIKMDSNIAFPIPHISKELLQNNATKMIPIRNEQFSSESNTSQKQFCSQAICIPFDQRNISTTKDGDHHGSINQELPKIPLSKDLTNENIKTINLLESPPSTCGEQQNPSRQIFKPRVEDWDVSLVLAIQNNRVLLLKNLVSGLHSDELAESFAEIMKIKCEVRIIPPPSCNYQTTMALLKLPSAKKAQDVIHDMESKYVIVANRLVSATLFNYLEFKAFLLSKYYGHLEFPKEGRDFIIEDHRNIVATSHLAQGNTIEFAYGLPWRVLDEQHDEQWQMLQEAHYSNSCKKAH